MAADELVGYVLHQCCVGDVDDAVMVEWRDRLPEVAQGGRAWTKPTLEWRNWVGSFAPELQQ